MKKSITTFLLLLLTGSLSKGFSQSIAPSVMNTGGGSAIAGNYIVEFNLGELVATGTAVTTNLVVTQGVLQPPVVLRKPARYTASFSGSKKEPV